MNPRRDTIAPTLDDYKAAYGAVEDGEYEWVRMMPAERMPAQLRTIRGVRQRLIDSGVLLAETTDEKGRA